MLVASWALAAVVFLQSFTRYALNSLLRWTEEITRHLLIALTFVGSAMAVRKESHAAVGFFYTTLAPPGRQRLALVADAATPLFYAASSTIGPIIPPSLPTAIYGVMANTSIGHFSPQASCRASSWRRRRP